MLAFLAILLLAGMIGFISVVKLSNLAQKADSIATVALAGVYRVASIDADIAESRSAALEILTRLQLNNASGAEESVRTLASVETEMLQNEKAYAQLIRGPEQHGLWHDATANWQRYKKEQDRAISVAQDGLAGEAQKILIGQAKVKFDDVGRALRKLIDYSKADAERARLAAFAMAAEARRTVLALLGLATAIGIAVAVLMTRAITRPLHYAISLLKKIGGGKLDNAIDISRGDEMGELLSGLASMQTELRERAALEQRRVEDERVRSETDRRALEEVKEMVAAVVDGHLERRLATGDKSGFALQLAHSLNRLIEDVAGVVQGVGQLVDSANAGDLTRRMDVANCSGLERQIGAGINQLVAEMADMVARVKDAAAEVSRGASEISRGNESLSRRTEDQAMSLKQTAASMEQMTVSVRHNAENSSQANLLAIDAGRRAEQGGAVISSAVQAMEGINVASKKIADIVGVIDGIAFQTNLLALNAAVEAARAGEQGRGFAVVASAVRTLASRSAEAARQIKDLIHDSVTQVADGARLVGDSGATFGQLAMAVKKVGDIIAEIATSSSEQAAGINQVGNAITQMDVLTQQNAALVSQAAAASRVLAEQSQGLSDTMSRYQVAANVGRRALKPRYSDQRSMARAAGAH
jgi:methyl-accepting chemotaxis protein